MRNIIITDADIFGNKKETYESNRDSFMNSAVIRVSETNVIKADNEALGLKSGDVITIPFETVLSVLDAWAQEKKDLKYFTIKHDEDPKNVHYHIVISFSKKSKCRFSTLKSKFPYGCIERAHSGVKACVQYLTHMNNPEKNQYDWSNVYTNAPEKLEEYKIPGKVSDKVKLNDTLRKILSGEIKEYDLYDSTKVDPFLFIKYKAKLDNAVLLKNQQILSNPQRKIEVFYLHGETATGKTLFCQQYAKDHKKAICISSSSNDPLQDYIGSEIFVFDDYEFTMPIMDFAKSIDPHNCSSVKSRYRNKVFVGDTIFITSNKNVLSLYPDALEDERAALFRKINKVYEFEHTETFGISKITINKIDISRDKCGKYHFALIPIDEKIWDFRDLIS